MASPRTTLRRLRPLGLMLLALALGSMAAQQGDTTVELPRSLTAIPGQAAQNLQTVTESVQDAQPGLVRVTHVVDGDTVRVKLNGKEQAVRLLGIDTPETHDPRKPVQCFGEAAAAHSRSLMENQLVRLEPDPENSNTDKYGRLLRYIYLSDGTLVNTQLVAEGYAFAYTVFPLTKLDELRQLETEARLENRGLWAGCVVDDSREIKQTTGQK